MARVLTSSRQRKYHLLLERVHWAEREQKREWALRNSPLKYGDELLNHLEQLLIHQPGDDTIDAWLIQAGDQAQAKDANLTASQFRKLKGALSPIVRMLKPGSSTRSAILAGAYFSKQRTEQLKHKDKASQLPQLDLSRSVRSLKDIRDLRVFKSRSPYAWKRLCWVVLGAAHE